MINSYNQVKIGERLKKVRNEKNLTLKEMSKISGISVSGLGEMETGVIKPNPKYLNLLAAEFNVNLNWIFTGKGSPFLPGFEIKYDFGQDSQRIMEMIYLMEHCPQVRYEMLRLFLNVREANEERIKKYLPDS